MCEKKAKMGNEMGEEEMIAHPLMNTLILESIFDYLGVPDLKVARQVSSFWRDCVQKKWDKVVKLRIEEISEHRSPQGYEKYQRFLQMLAHEEGEEVPPLEVGIHENWTALCDKIKTLELKDVTFPTVNSLRNALFVCFPNLKNLILGLVVVLEVEHLSSEPTAEQPLQLQIEDEQRNLKSLTVTLKDADPSLPISWMEVLAHFPALEAISLSKFTEIRSMFQAIYEIREEDPSKLNLKHLVIDWCSFINFAPATIATLKDTRLRLETLGIFKLWDSNAVSHFRDILQVHAGTLKKLDFVGYPNGPFPHDSPIPQLEYVQELKINFSLYSIEAIGFLQFTPNLRKLILHALNSVSLGADVFNFNQFTLMLRSCEELELLQFYNSLSLEDMKSMAEWMPNLKILRMNGLDNATFAMICESWTGLVELHVQKSDVTSSGFLGWDEEDMKRWYEEDLERLDSMKRSEPAPPPPLWRPITVPKANITSLKKLQLLNMSVTGGNRHTRTLTRAVGLHGIEELPALRRLRLNDYMILSEDQDYWKQLLDSLEHRR